MRLNGGVLGVAIAALPMGALSDLVTVTEYPSACSAIYTSGSRSATVVTSTVTVSPTPFTDASINAGVPFAVEIQPVGPARKRQASTSTFLDAEGYTTTDPDQAVFYRILNGTLSSTLGGSVTANPDDTSVPFAVSSVLGSIRTQFAARNLSLNWNNAAFKDGAAEFVIVPLGNNTQRVVAYLNGERQDGWIAVSFGLRPTGGLVIESSSSVGSTTISTIVSMGSMSGAPSAGATTTASSGSVPAISPSAGVSSPASASPTPSGNVSPDGICGAGTNFNCWGADDGNCCSPYGYCGGYTDRDLYCGEGCQSEYGECDSPTVSSPGVEPTPTSGSAVWSSIVVVSSPPPAVSSSRASTIVSLSTSGSVVYSVTFTPTPSSSVAVSSAAPTVISLSTSGEVTYSITVTPSSSLAASTNTLPTYSDGASPINPGGPDLTSSEPVPTTSGADETPSFTIVSSIESSSSSALSSSASSAGSSISSAASSIRSSVSSQVSSASSNAASSPSSVLSSAASSVSSVRSSVVSSISSSQSSSVSSSSSVAVTSSIASSSTTSSLETGVIISEPTLGVPSPIPASSTEVSSTASFSVVSSTTVSSSSSSSSDAPPAYTSPTVGPPTIQAPSSSTSTVGPFSSSSIIAPSSSPAVTSSSSSSSSSSIISSSSPIASSSSTPASSSSSSAGASSTWLVLPSPTPCDFGDPMDWDEDDTNCEIDLPQPMTIYRQSDTKTYACTNGFISIGIGSSQYQADPLPSETIPTNTVVPFWDDLNIFGGQAQRQGIYYQLTDVGVTYEYYLARAGVINEIYHWTVGYNYSRPGVFVYTYYIVGNGNNGKFASVGMQGTNADGTAIGYQYGYETTDITPGRIVTCDTLANVCSTNAPNYAP